MRRLPYITVFAVLLGALLFVNCGERDPKALTDTASEALQARDYQTSLTGFEHVLQQIDASHAQYMRASLGRCVALAHVDPAKGKDEFLKLAQAQKARLEPADIHFVVSEFVKVGDLGLATDIMVVVQQLFPNTKAMQDIGNAVADAAIRSGDTKTRSRLKSLGYVGSGK